MWEYMSKRQFFDNVIVNFSRKNKVPSFLKSRIFRTVVVIFMFYMFGSGIYKNWGNAIGIGMVFYRMIVITTFIGIILSFSIIIELGVIFVLWEVLLL